MCIRDRDIVGVKTEMVKPLAALLQKIIIDALVVERLHQLDLHTVKIRHGHARFDSMRCV